MMQIQEDKKWLNKYDTYDIVMCEKKVTYYTIIYIKLNKCIQLLNTT